MGGGRLGWAWAVVRVGVRGSGLAFSALRWWSRGAMREGSRAARAGASRVWANFAGSLPDSGRDPAQFANCPRSAALSAANPGQFGRSRESCASFGPPSLIAHRDHRPSAENAGRWRGPLPELARTPTRAGADAHLNRRGRPPSQPPKRLRSASTLATYWRVSGSIPTRRTELSPW